MLSLFSQHDADLFYCPWPIGHQCDDIHLHCQGEAEEAHISPLGCELQTILQSPALDILFLLSQLCAKSK